VTVLVAALGGLGLSGALVAFCWWLAKWAKSSAAQRDALADRKRQIEILNDDLVNAVEARNTVIDDLKAQIERETKARKSVEKSLEEMQDELAKSGNMPAVATGIRAQLERLRALSEKEVPSVPAAASGEDG
jgi:C4-dicarboxylate-specific signal transduction histidine kinase